MPRLIAADTEESIELADLVERLETGPFDAQDEDLFASWGPSFASSPTIAASSPTS